MNILDPIRKVIEIHGLIPDDSQIVVAVSGGADSVALLHALHTLGVPVTVAHMNHQLRGADSDADEAFVRKLANELGVPFFSTTADVNQLAEESGQSIEMAARQARHEFFSEFAGETIALAHHADDQVETFLLKLARGAGTEGLGGMSFCQSIHELRIIRPMLEIRRSEILEWLVENELTWREDASNLDEHFLRNRVRHTILPLLEHELNPDIQNTILRTMDILREENAWMEGVLENQPFTAQQPLAAKRRLLRNWLFENGVNEIDYDAGEKILSLMKRGRGTKVYQLNERQRVVVEYGRPRFEQDEGPENIPSWKLSIEEGTGWRRDPGDRIGLLPAEASFDADRVGDATIEVRTYLPGDRMEPLGVDGSRKLQDIFTDCKVPRDRRKCIPVVLCRGEIIWLPGYRIASGWAVREPNGKSMHVRIEQNSHE